MVGNLFRKRPCFFGASLPIFRVIQRTDISPFPLSSVGPDVCLGQLSVLLRV